jgi:Fe-S cluster assembly protein SufD
LAEVTATNLDARREAARARIAELELPTFRGTAGWEFTPIDKLDLDAYPAAPGGTAPSSFGLDEAPPEGAIVMRWRRLPRSTPELVERHLGSVVAGDTPFVARQRRALGPTSTFVYVPPQGTVHEPIVVTTRTSKAGTALHWRLLSRPRGGTAQAWCGTSRALRGLPGQRRRRARGRPERAPAPRRPAGPRGDLVGLRTQRPPSAATARLDWITLGFGSDQRKDLPGDPARRRGRPTAA